MEWPSTGGKAATIIHWRLDLSSFLIVKKKLYVVSRGFISASKL